MALEPKRTHIFTGPLGDIYTMACDPEHVVVTVMQIPREANWEHMESLPTLRKMGLPNHSSQVSLTLCLKWMCLLSG